MRSRVGLFERTLEIRVDKSACEAFITRMSRTKGAKDKAPRSLNPASLANLPSSIPGMESVSLRIYATSGDVRWFARMEPRQRGEVITKARRMSDES